MATPCAIIKQRADGLWYESSIRSDGYLTMVGVTLWKWYQDPAVVDRLIDCGWVSPLEPKIEYHEAHKDPHEDDILKHETRDAAIKSGIEQGMVFLFENDRWSYIEQDYDEKTGQCSAKPAVVIDREMLLAADCIFKLTDKDLDERDDEPPFWDTMDADWQKKIAENTDPNVTYYGGNGVYGVSYVSPPLPKVLAPEDRDPDRYERFIELVQGVKEEIALDPTIAGPALDAAQNYAIAQFGFANTPEAAPFYDPRVKRSVDVTSVEALKAVPESAMVALIPMGIDDAVIADLEAGNTGR